MVPDQIRIDQGVGDLAIITRTIKFERLVPEGSTLVSTETVIDDGGIINLTEDDTELYII